MKKAAVLFTFLVGWMIALAQPSALPSDPRFDAPTTFVTQSDGESLRAMIDSLARSIGLTPIVDKIPADKIVTYNIDQAKPFRQIWDLVLGQEGLDFVLQNNDIIVIGSRDSLAGLLPPPAVEPTTVVEGENILQKFFRVNNNPKDVGAIVQQSIPGVQVDALESVNSISVRGTQEQLDRVQVVLSQFDSASAVIPMERKVYKLNNAQAATGEVPDPANLDEKIEVIGLADILAQTLEGVTVQVDNAAAPAEGENAAAPANSGTQVDVKIVADPRTNSLIVTAPAEIQVQIAELIDQLDIPQPLINVQVRIQEVTRENAQDLGIDLSTSLGNFAFKALEESFQFVFDAQRAVTGLNIGAVLDTLERQGLSRRVDDGNVTVINNGVGRLQAGGTLYILIAGVDENIERVIPYGVQLDLSPRLNNDGKIILSVIASLDILPSNATNPSFLNLSTRQVRTTVTLDPGQTILLSGLFQNSFTTETQGVPILSSIPIIGQAFSTTNTTERNSELLLVVTADVLQ
jgi:type II secretory pathway component GspD/PulD (secretin)